jgi:hypothetical protein
MQSTKEKYGERLEVTQEGITQAEGDVWNKLEARVLEKGNLSLVSPAETEGILAEEFNELERECEKNNLPGERQELLDIAVGAAFSLASIRAMTTNYQGGKRVPVTKEHLEHVKSFAPEHIAVLAHKYKNHSFISGHEISGFLRGSFRDLLTAFGTASKNLQARTLYKLLAGCIYAIASIDVGGMDW